MKNKRLVFGTMILAIVLMASMSTFAQRGFRGAGPGPMQNGPMIPGLTDKQKTEIKAIKEQHQKEMQALQTERLEKGKYPNREAFQSAMLKKVSDHKVAVRNLLTEEQKAAFDKQQARQGQPNRGNFAPQRGGGQGCMGCPGCGKQGNRQGNRQGNMQKHRMRR